MGAEQSCEKCYLAHERKAEEQETRIADQEACCRERLPRASATPYRERAQEERRNDCEDYVGEVQRNRAASENRSPHRAIDHLSHRHRFGIAGKAKLTAGAKPS